jgi:CO dehydrogenase/acetyl-CoA synthase alpha subunit
MECGHAAKVLRLRSWRSGKCCYFRFVVFVCPVEEVCNICTLSRRDVLFSSRGRFQGSPVDPWSVRFLTRQTHVLRSSDV